MKSFIEILNEASVSGSNLYNASVKIVRFLEKRIGQEYIDYDGQNYTNSEGNFFGYHLVGEVISINPPIVAIEDIHIVLDAKIPGDIQIGEMLGFHVSRLDY